MDDSARALYETRAGSLAGGKLRIEILAAASSAAYAFGGFLLLPLRQRSDPEWTRGNLLCLAAAHCRGRAVADGPRGKVTWVGQPAPKRRLIQTTVFDVIILGLNAFHADSAAAIVRDGKLIAAAEEERFRRVKHWAGFPTQAIEYCLREARVDLSDVDHVAVNQDSRANIFRKLGYVLSHRPNLALVIARWRNRQHRAGVLDC